MSTDTDLDTDKEKDTDLDIEKQKKLQEGKALAETQLLRGRVNDYVAIVLAVGTVILLWFLQWLGLY